MIEIYTTSNENLVQVFKEKLKIIKNYEFDIKKKWQKYVKINSDKYGNNLGEFCEKLLEKVWKLNYFFALYAIQKKFKIQELV